MPSRRPLNVEQVLAWADAHRERWGVWPAAASGPVRDAPVETWNGINQALRDGLRGLPGGGSLARLLAERRGKPLQPPGPPLTVEQVLAWADAHHARTGRWPTLQSGPVPEAPAENWANINTALSEGYRELPGGGSLAVLLERRRGVQRRAQKG
jgi:hypothetical protein